MKAILLIFILCLVALALQFHPAFAVSVVAMLLLLAFLRLIYRVVQSHLSVFRTSKVNGFYVDENHVFRNSKDEKEVSNTTDDTEDINPTTGWPMNITKDITGVGWGKRNK